MLKHSQFGIYPYAENTRSLPVVGFGEDAADVDEVVGALDGDDALDEVVTALDVVEGVALGVDVLDALDGFGVDTLGVGEVVGALVVRRVGAGLQVEDCQTQALRLSSHSVPGWHGLLSWRYPS